MEHDAEIYTTKKEKEFTNESRKLIEKQKWFRSTEPSLIERQDTIKDTKGHSTQPES